MRVAFQESPLKLYFLLVLDPVTPLDAQVEQVDAVMDHTLLDLVIKRAIGLK